VDELLERLAEAACGDATAGIGQPGCIALEFVRHANSAAAALEGALSDVKLAMPDAALISTDFFD
jgi:hypothetical protein